MSDGRGHGEHEGQGIHGVAVISGLLGHGEHGSRRNHGRVVVSGIHVAVDVERAEYVDQWNRFLAAVGVAQGELPCGNCSAVESGPAHDGGEGGRGDGVVSLEQCVLGVLEQSVPEEPAPEQAIKGFVLLWQLGVSLKWISEYSGQLGVTAECRGCKGRECEALAQRGREKRGEMREPRA